MYTITTSRYKIVWGDRYNSISPDDIQNKKTSTLWQELIDAYQLDSLYVLNQIHSTLGFRVTSSDQNIMSLYAQSGDYSMTDQKKIGLVILTADCIPLLLYDPVKQSCAAIHAGWRGAVHGIVSAACKDFEQAYGSLMRDVQVFFGPSAGICCYVVGDDFYENFKSKEYVDDFFMKKEGCFYFNNKKFVLYQLLSLGILEKNIYDKQSICTICSPQYCSFRREGGMAQRQITMITLL